MANTFDPYFALQADCGQPDNVTEAFYDFLDSAAAEGLSEAEALAAWDNHRARRGGR